MGNREATDLSTAPVLSGAVEAFVGSHSNNSIGVELPSNNDWGNSSFNSNSIFNSPSQSLILPPPSPPHDYNRVQKQGIHSTVLQASPPNSPPPNLHHQPQTSSPLNPNAQQSSLPQSPKISNNNNHLSTSNSPSPKPGTLITDSPASHRISLLNYSDVISERPTSAIPLQTAISHQSPPMSHLFTNDNTSNASPAAACIETERNREFERAALSKGLEARLEALSLPESPSQLSRNLSPQSPQLPRNVSPSPNLNTSDQSLTSHAPAEQRELEEKETVTERGAERLSHRIQSLAA